MPAFRVHGFRSLFKLTSYLLACLAAISYLAFEALDLDGSRRAGLLAENTAAVETAESTADRLATTGLWTPGFPISDLPWLAHRLPATALRIRSASLTPLFLRLHGCFLSRACARSQTTCPVSPTSEPA